MPVSHRLFLTPLQNFAQSQVDYALGKNPMSGVYPSCSRVFPADLSLKVPYIVGSNPNSPSNPHSAMASGGNDIGNIDTSPEQEAYVLYGAVVGGPTKDDKFFDIRSDWPETEVRDTPIERNLKQSCSLMQASRLRWIIMPPC